MVELISGLQESVVRANLDRVERELAEAHQRSCAAGTDGGRGAPRILAATKYVALADMPTLAAAGVKLVGENRAQDLQEKFQAHGELFEWHFIGQLQSRKVKVIVPYVSVIHSVASDSSLRELERHRGVALPGLRILIEVNLAGEAGKAGIDPDHLDAFIDRSPFPVAGLMTMPPLSHDPESSRPWFRSLRALADERGLEQLSMGTSQDYVVAAEEGATIVRIGTGLYRG